MHKEHPLHHTLLITTLNFFAKIRTPPYKIKILENLPGFPTDIEK